MTCETTVSSNQSNHQLDVLANPIYTRPHQQNSSPTTIFTYVGHTLQQGGVTAIRSEHFQKGALTWKQGEEKLNHAQLEIYTTNEVQMQRHHQHNCFMKVQWQSIIYKWQGWYLLANTDLGICRFAHVIRKG